MSRRAAILTSALVLAASPLAACSDDGGSSSAGPTSDSTPSVSDGQGQTSDGVPDESSSPSDSPTAGSTDYLDVPTGVALTAQGTGLELGDEATVAWVPRQGVVGVLALTIRRVEKASYRRDFVGWNIPATERSSQPYFVRGRVRNVGETELGRRPIPLYIADATDLLIEPTGFKSTFKPCPGGRIFPPTFAPGDAADVCLVYLAPNGGELAAVSFRPTEDFAPISWTGAVLSTQPAATPGKSTKGGKTTKGGKADKADKADKGGS